MSFRLTRQQKNTIYAFTLILPSVLLLGLTILSPLIKSILMSLESNSLLSADRSWNNFDNYSSILEDGELYHSLRVTFTYVVCVVSIEFIVGMALALVLHSNIKFRAFFRSILMIPWAVPMIVAALIFLWIYQSDYGVLNYVLRQFGLIETNINWVSDIQFALIAVMITAVWRQTPLMGMMLLAGLQGIPKSLYEAARIDGAGSVQSFFRITLPSLKPVIGTVTLLMIVTNFQMFTLFYTLTAGGPMDATKSLAILTYEIAFEQYDLGRGAAVGVIWLVLLFLFSSVYMRLFNQERN